MDGNRAHEACPYDGYYDAGGLVQVTDGAVYRLTAMENHNNMNPADGGDKDYDFWQQYWSDYVTDYWLCTYEPDGTLSGKVQITRLEDFADEQGRVEPSSLLWEDDGAFLAMGGAILRIGRDGSVQKTEDVRNRLTRCIAIMFPDTSCMTGTEKHWCMIYGLQRIAEMRGYAFSDGL